MAAPAPAKPQTGPRPLAPILDGQRGDAAADRGVWFADLGSFERPAATKLWRKLRADHPSALAGMERLASAGGAGAEPLLLGPIASEQAARDLCGTLQPSVASCRPTSL
jgi:SPOR domain